MIRFDTKEFEKFAKKIDAMKRDLEKGLKLYLNYLIKDCNIESELLSKINETVYSRPEPDWYERTGRLLKAARVKLEGNQLYLYMDDDWLNSQLDNEYNPSKGFDKNSRSGSYAKRVEEGYTYYNQGNKTHPYKRSGSHYMEKTYIEVKSKIKSGEYKPEKILEPLVKKWRG